MKNPELVDGGIAVDDRGTVSYVNEVSQQIKRIYYVSNFERGMIRAWHGHKKETKGVLVTKGSAIVIAIPMENIEWTKNYSSYDLNGLTCEPNVADKHILSENKPQILWIPKGYVNGFKTLTEDTQVLFLSTSTLEESKNDDIRFSADIFRHLWNVEER